MKNNLDSLEKIEEFQLKPLSKEKRSEIINNINAVIQLNDSKTNTIAPSFFNKIDCTPKPLKESIYIQENDQLLDVSDKIIGKLAT